MPPYVQDPCVPECPKNLIPQPVCEPCGRAKPQICEPCGRPKGEPPKKEVTEVCPVDPTAALDLIIAFEKIGPQLATTNLHRLEGRQRARSRELRASILYVGCDCEKRNGLQDDCRRTGCHGSRECKTKPPTCAPSEFSNAKHLERIRTRAMNKGA